MEWVNNIKAEDLQEGDIIETPSKFPSDHSLFPDVCVPLVKHYAVAVLVDGKIMVVHNTIGNQPSMDTVENLFKHRGIGRVMRTGTKSEDILKKYNECKDRKYHVSSWNCEDFVSSVTGANIGYDQRNGYGMLTAVVIVIILFLILGK